MVEIVSLALASLQVILQNLKFGVFGSKFFETLENECLLERKWGRENVSLPGWRLRSIEDGVAGPDSIIRIGKGAEMDILGVTTGYL